MFEHFHKLIILNLITILCATGLFMLVLPAFAADPNEGNVVSHLQQDANQVARALTDSRAFRQQSPRQEPSLIPRSAGLTNIRMHGNRP